MQHRSHITRILAFVGVVGLAATFSSFVPQMAHADPGDSTQPTPVAFAGGTSQQVYIAQAVQCTADSGGDQTGTNCEQLYVAVRTVDPENPNGAIQVKFNPVGPVYNGGFNAIGYRMEDNYIYGIDKNFNLVRVGQQGQVQIIGQIPGLPIPGNGMSYNAGTFGADGSLDRTVQGDPLHDADTSNIYYLRTGQGTGNSNLYGVDFSNCAAGFINTNCLTTTTYTLSQPMPNTADLVWMSGELWAVSGKAATGNFSAAQSQGVWRVDVLNTPGCTTPACDTSGESPNGNTPTSWYSMSSSASATNWTDNGNGVGSFNNGDTLPNGVVTNTGQGYGAQWVYGNGNIGISNNQQGWVFQVRVNNPTSTTVDPSFAMVAVLDGPASNGNDGTIFPGEPVDLGLTKTTNPGFVPGQPITYTLTVDNTSEPDGADSSGYSVTDDISQLMYDLGWMTDSSGNTLTDSAAIQDAVDANLTLPPDCQAIGENDGESIPTVTVSCIGGPLAANATHRFQFSVNTPSDVTKIHLTNNQLSNTATVVGNESDPNPSNDTSTINTSPVSLTLTKSAAEKTVSKAGDVIHYTFSVQNTGAVTMNGVKIVDAMPGIQLDPSCATIGNLVPQDPTSTTTTPGSTGSCTGTYTVQASDITAAANSPTAQIKNTATATGTPDGTNLNYTSDPKTAAVDVAHMTLSKSITSVDTQQANPVAKTVYAVGDVIHYQFSVKNDGTIAMTNATVVDSSLPSPGVQLSGCTWPTLAAGATQTCTGTYTVQQNDMNTTATTIHNSATVTGTPTGTSTVYTSDPSTADANLAGTPQLTLVKSVISVKDVVTGNTTMVPTVSSAVSVHQAGDIITYQFRVTNTGAVSMSNIHIVDSDLGGNVQLSGCSWASLAPNDPAVTCTGTYTVTAADIAAGTRISNTATATGQPDNSTTPYTSDPKTANVDISHLTLTKTATESSVSNAGDVIHYQFTVKNDGTVSMSTVSVTDTGFNGAVELNGCSWATLGAGQTVQCTGTYTVTASDISAGNALVNSATATGTPVGSGTSYTTPVQRATVGVAHLSIVKTAQETSVSSAGQTIHYAFSVKNDGDIVMNNVTVVDTSLPSPGVQLSGCSWTSVAVGTTVQCTGTYTVTAADIAADTPIVNVAHAQGTTPGGTTVNGPPDDATVAIATPHLTVDKVASRGTFTKVGDVITYTLTVTNDGQVTMNNVAITDTLPGLVLGAGCANLGTLAVEDVASCTATYTVQAADITAGTKIINTATATGTPDGGTTPYTSDPGTATVELAQLTLTKTAAEKVVLKAGDVIHYTFSVQNTGTVTMSSVQVVDTSLPNLNMSGCQNLGTLAPGSAAVTCSATYTVTDADIAAAEQGQKIVNSATATGIPAGSNTPYTSDPKTATVDVAQLVISKSADRNGVSSAGDIIHYTFTVQNQGTVTMNNVSVVDTSLPSPGVQLSGCTWASMSPGATVTCSGTYTVTAADVASGTDLVNTATATGTPTGGTTPLTSPPSTFDVGVHPPHLTVTKAANPTSATRAGQVITYTITVVNDGQVTMNNVAIHDALAGVVLSDGCKSLGTLAVGDRATCTAMYAVTQNDMNAGGTIVNTATASGTPDGGTTPYTSDPAQAPVQIAQDTELDLAVNVNKATGAITGDKLIYTYTVTNSGNVPMTNVTITKVSFSGKGTWPQPDLSTCTGDFTPPLTSSTVLAPGGQIVCQSVPYTVLDDDVANGEITNTAIATGTPAPEVHAGGIEPKTSDPASVQTLPSTPTPVTPAPVAAATGGSVATGGNALIGLSIAGACLLGMAAVGWLGLMRRRRLEDAS